MRGKWFRLYDELLDDPKVQSLPPEDFKAWVNLLCLANRNEGRLPSVEAIAFALRIDNIAARSLVDRFLIGGLIDKVKGGSIGWGIAPHGWTQRQYKSDNNNQYVKAYRERAGKDGVIPSETDTETDTEEEKMGTRARTATPERRREIPEGTSDLYDAVLAAMMLDHNCSQRAWRGVQEVVANYAAAGRTPDFVRRQAEWFRTEHWIGKRGEPPSAANLIDSALHFAALGNGSKPKPKPPPVLTPEQIAKRDRALHERQRLAVEQMERLKGKVTQ